MDDRGMKVIRLDRSRLDASLRTPQGFLKAPVVITRLGVFKYRRGDGTVRRELRLAEEVFKPESLATARGLPITNEHPTELVNPQNIKGLSIGFTSDRVEIKDGSFLESDATIMDAKAIDDVDGGKQEVSLGYTCDLDFTPGTFNGEDYDCIQRDIIYNHLALTQYGRAGSDVSLKLDSEDAVLLNDDHQGDQMEKITINGQEFEMSPEACVAVKALMESNETMKTDMDAAKASAASIETEKKDAEAKIAETEEKLDTVQAKLDSAMEELKVKKDSQDPEKLQTLVNKRIKVLEVGRHTVKDSVKLDAMTDLQIMKEVIKSKSSVDLKDKSEAYVTARFDSIAEEVEKDIAKKKEVGESFSKHFDSTGAKDGSADEAKKRQHERTYGSKQ